MDASLYSPDPGLVPRYVAYLSQRDLSYQVPVNFVPQPGVALSAACFSGQRYEDAAATRCISNLLAVGFRRLEVDVFWDASRSLWSLCPVELGSSSQALTTSTTSLLPTGTEPASIALSQRQNELTAQTAATSLSSMSIADASNTLTVSADATTTALDATGTSTAYTDGSAIQIGAYTCTPTLDFDLLLNILSARLTDTATDLNASTIIMTLNVHAAASASAPSDSAQQPADELLPSPDNLLSSVISRNLSSRVYTPANLLAQRGSLNSSQSWFTVNPDEQPLSAYFQVNTSSSGSSSQDGWPDEVYIEMSAAKRLLIEFGSIDPQMIEYNLSGDSSTIFPQSYLNEPTSITFNSNGTIATGCLFDPAVTTIPERNNSWALSQIGDGATYQGELLQILNSAKSLIDCGISPFLNETLAGSTAESYQPYLEFVEKTIWSWEPNQPVNSSLRDDLNDYRCAALNATSGMWLASDCGSSRYGACRISNQPYGWKITYAATPYDRINLACDDGSVFDVPRTSLENAHLLSVWRAFRDNQDDDNGELLWLDFNQLDISACWVIGGNSTCPYMNPTNSKTRRIVVPVVGAIIVFVLAALTVLIKCAGNRQTAKRRKRRGNDGWDYEGVPS